MGDVYFKVTPQPIFIKLTEEEINSMKYELVDLIAGKAYEADAAQIWKDAIKYGFLNFERVTKEEAQDHGWFREEDE